MNKNFLPKVMGIALLTMVGCSHGSDGISENLADTTSTITNNTLQKTTILPQNQSQKVL